MVLDVQTLVSASPLLKSEKGTTIRASAVVEVPSHCEITTDKAVSEPEGIIRVGQGKETYAVIPVSYFGPTP
jgi:hypothetical protein